MTSIRHDFRYGLRMLAKSPGFTVVAALTLALGIGANTAIFSIVNALLLRPLPYPNANRLVLITENNPARGLVNGFYSLIRYHDMAEHNRSFAELAAYCFDTFNLTRGDQPEQLQGARITYNLLTALGVHPVAGRNFLPSEDQRGGRPVVLISQALWERRFGSDPNLVGGAITLNGVPYTVIGIAPRSLGALFPAIDIFATSLSEYSQFTSSQVEHGAGYLVAAGLLKPGIGLEQAQADADVLNRRYQQNYSNNVDADANATLLVSTLQSQVVTGVRTTLLVLTGAVAFVLLIGCANIASLLMARANARKREIAIRAALGAGQSDLLRQLLAESVVLSLLGGGIGLVIAVWATALAGKISETNLPRVQEIQTDWQVLAFTLALSVLAGLVFGLMPSLQSSRADVSAVLRESTRGSTGSAHRSRVRSLLVVAQIALSVVLLIGAGLLLRSFVRLQQVDTGFDPANVLSMQISLAPSRYATDEQKTVFFDRAIREIDSIPGIESSAAGLTLPLLGSIYAPMLVDGQPVVPFAARPLVEFQSITPAYFQTLRIPLLRGRYFTENDKKAAAPVAIVNAALARKFWPNEDAVGKYVVILQAQIHSQIVGVVGGVKSTTLEADVLPQLYLPYPQRAWPAMGMVVRGAGDPMRLSQAVQAKIAAVDKDQPVTNVKTMQDVVDTSFGQRKLTLLLVGIFAAVALLLAMVGIYGTMAYSVSQRTQELGIRRALGAQQADVLRLVAGQGLGLAIIGIALGVLAAAALTRLLSSLLFRVSPTDPAVFAAIAVLFALVALAAAYFPARKAAAVDPMEALRCE
jgi:putative ABC transport system permease protein